MENLNNRMESLIRLRKEIHKNPELSGKEYNTSKRILAFLEKYQPDELHTEIGKTGIIAIYKGKNTGKTTMFRCELDALPIQETNSFEHRSIYKNCSHKCGHDGHMAILCGLATELFQNKLEKGTIILLFQPSEENGKGASKVLKNAFFKNLKLDYVFALHNLPNYSKNQIIIKKDTFSCAVLSMKILLKGKTAHAGEPEKGINPAMTIASIIQDFDSLNQSNIEKSDFSIITPIYSTLGKKAYGVSAGQGEIHFTIRCQTNTKITALKKELVKVVENCSKLNHLNFQIKWIEPFFANENSSVAVDLIANAANKLGFDVFEKKEPFRWGEDFGLFTTQYSGAMFGLGAGIETPDLHNPDYDFPDEIISTGVKLFYQICKDLEYA